MNDKFLPIGSVVLLKGGNKEVMITSYCIFPKKSQIKEGKEIKPEIKLYEYGGCLYPEGILDTDTVCAFNHDQIDKICYVGYETEEQAKLSKTLNEQYDKIKSEFEKSISNS